MPQSPSSRVVEFDGKEYEFPSDATDVEISNYLKAIPAANAKHMPKARTWTDVAVDAVPAAVATVGGLIGATGGPFTAVGGAALGGMVGDALKQGANKLRGEAVPETVTGALGEMAGEGLAQGAIQAATAGTGAAMKAAAPAIMRSALGNTAATLTRKPDVAKVALETGATVTRSGVHHLDDMLAAKAASRQGFTKKEIQATRNAIAEAWKGLSPEKAKTLFGATAGNPAFRSMMAQGLYHAAGYFTGMSPIALRSLILAATED